MYFFITSSEWRQSTEPERALCHHLMYYDSDKSSLRLSASTEQSILIALASYSWLRVIWQSFLHHSLSKNFENSTFCASSEFIMHLIFVYNCLQHQAEEDAPNFFSLLPHTGASYGVTGVPQESSLF